MAVLPACLSTPYPMLQPKLCNAQRYGGKFLRTPRPSIEAESTRFDIFCSPLHATRGYSILRFQNPNAGRVHSNFTNDQHGSEPELKNLHGRSPTTPLAHRFLFRTTIISISETVRLPSPT